MISSKKLPVVVTVLVCVCLILCGFIVYAADAFDTTHTPEYQKRMFNGEIITLDIRVDEGDWQGLLNNAQAKEWISADLVINGEQVSTVGIRTKGNSSLSQGSRSGGNRYSLQFKFNKYVKGQNFYGLDTFCINNLMGDATYMKDYLAYDIMNYIGVDTPLISYASVTVNGVDYGFCTALERYEEAFLDRVYNTVAGQLYNVKIGMGMRGNFEDMWQDVENIFPGRRPVEEDRAQPGEFNFGDRQQAGDIGPAVVVGIGGFGVGGGTGGGSLVYSDDNISSYPAIFENSVFKSSDADKQRVITALKNLSEGTDLEKYFDVDQILRYFAAHTVLVNLDSYTSNMQQNYYIYERDGKITILPWDYGLSFGGFQSGSASSVVNYPIDTPVSGVSMESRPLLHMLLEVEEYREKYHAYLWQIAEGYFESGLFEQTVNDLDAKIAEYVKNDVSAYFTYEQYKASIPVLIELGNLRAKSIIGQLDGTIPSTSSGQSADASALIDASGINLSALGSMMGGGGIGQDGRQDWQGGQGGVQPGGQGGVQPGGQGGVQPGGQGGVQPGGPGGWPIGEAFDMEIMQQAMRIIMETGGELTDEARAAMLEIGLTEEQIDMFVNMQNRIPGGNRGPNMLPDENRPEGNMPGGNPPIDGGPGGNMPGGNPPIDGGPGGNTQGGGTGILRGTVSPNGAGSGYIIIGALMLLLVGAIIFVAKPRKNMI